MVKKKSPQCPVCERFFMTKDQLTHHMKQSHPDQAEASTPAERRDAGPAPGPVFLDEATGTAELYRHDDPTKNFVKFGHPFERGGQGDAIAGVLYLPKKYEKGVIGIRITLMKG